MRLLGKDGIIYKALAICIAIFLPIIVMICVLFIWMCSKITGKDFIK